MTDQRYLSNVNKYYKKLDLLFNSIIAISLIPYLILYLEMQHKNFSGLLGDEFYKKIVMFFGLLISVSGLFLGYLKYKRSKKHTFLLTAIDEKFFVYYVGMSWFYFLSGLSCFVLVVCAWISASYFLLIAYAVILLIMSFYRPSQKKYAIDLKLGKEQKEKFLHYQSHSFEK